MYISRIYIKNYRNFKEFDLYIPNGEPLTIIGCNNSGKTNLLRALRLVLDTNLPPWDKKLNENDFCWDIGNSPWEKGEEIVITLTFSDVKKKEEIIALLTFLDPSKNEQIISDNLEAIISFVFAPATYNKGSKYDLNDDYISFLVAGRYHPSGYYYLDNGEAKDYESSVFNLYARNNKDDFYKFFYLDNEDIETIRKDEKAAFDKKIMKQLYPNKIHKYINLLFLDATRDVKNDFYQGYNSLVSQLIRFGLQNNKKNGVTDEITKALKELRTNSSIPETNIIIADIEKRLQNEKANFLTNKADINIGTPRITLENIGRYFNFLVDLNEDLKKNLEMNVVGLGYQNLAYISAVFALFELKKEIFFNNTNEKIKIIYNLLLIEEPEAHLDVQNQKFLHTQIENKSNKLLNIEFDKNREVDIDQKFFISTQVIQTSHSTHLASKSDLRNIVVIQKNQKAVKVVSIDSILKNGEEHYWHRRRILKQYLDATRSSILFAKKVVLVEGLSEKYALGAILNSYLRRIYPSQSNINIDSEGIEIVEIGGKNFDSFSSLYSQNGLQNKCLIIKDGDSQLKDGLDINEYGEIYKELNKNNNGISQLLFKKNVFTFEIDTFFIPDPEDNQISNNDYLKLILFRFMKDGNYFKKKSFIDKIKSINEFDQNVKNKKLDSKDIPKFFNEILGYEVSKPSLSLYLSSLIKAKLLEDDSEADAWKIDHQDQIELGVKKFVDLPEFVVPKYIEEGIVWLITKNN